MPRQLSDQDITALGDAILRTAPPGLSEADLDRFLGPRLDGAIAQAENSPAPISGSVLRRLVANAASMLNPVSMAQGLYKATTGPGSLPGAIAMGMRQQGAQAADAWKQGHMSEAFGHGLASALPGIGPAAAAIGEQGASGDIAGAIGAGVGLLAPTGVPMVTRGALRLLPERAAAAAEAGAARRITKVMSPTVGANKMRFGNMAEKAAPELAPDLLANNAPWTREGYQAQIASKLEGAEQGLDVATDARNATKSIDTQAMINDLLRKRQILTSEAVQGSQVPRTAVPRSSAIVDESGTPFTVTDMKSSPIGRDIVPAPNAARVAVIDQAIHELQQLGSPSRYEPVRVMRQAYDGPAKAIYSPSMTADYLKAQGGKLGAADVTSTLREQLASTDPQTAAANAQYSLYRSAHDVLEATREVERTRPRVGRLIAARIFGSLIGGETAGVPGAVAGYIAAPMLDAASAVGFTTKLKVARLQMRLADAIRHGDVKLVTGLTTEIKSLAKETAKASRLVIAGVEAGPEMTPTEQR